MEGEGKCGLCGCIGKLCKSHIDLPKFVHKRLRSEGLANPHPVVVTKTNITRSEIQEKKPLLCQRCEDLFNKQGERWVAAHCLQPNGSFPLVSLLKDRVSQHGSAGEVGFFPTYKLREVNGEALIYFAASMLWRAQFNMSLKPIRLGPYELGLREFLLNEAAFPEHIYLNIAVRLRSTTSQVTYGVHGGRLGHLHSYRFAIPGLSFFFTVGRYSGAFSQSGCFVRCPFKPLFDTQLIDQIDRDGMDKILNKLRSDGYQIPQYALI